MTTSSALELKKHIDRSSSILECPPPLTTQTLRQLYFRCYWPDFNQTLNKGSWEHIQQIKTVTTTFVIAKLVLETIVHITNISFQAEHFRLQSCYTFKSLCWMCKTYHQTVQSSKALYCLKICFTHSQEWLWSHSVWCVKLIIKQYKAFDDKFYTSNRVTSKRI